MERLSADELEQRARNALPPAVYDFVAAGAGTERSLRSNREAWSQQQIVPRVLQSASDVSTGVQVNGTALTSPILLAPTGRQLAIHPDGEMGGARAAANFGTVYTLATSATTDLHDVAKTGAQLWQQLYVSTDRDWTSMVMAECARVGFQRVVITVDRAREAYRPRAARHGGIGPLPSGVAVTSHRGDGSTRTSEPGVWDASLKWGDVSELIRESSIPVAVKGVLHPADAQMAVEAGASEVIVSNHGGRQIDGVIPTADALSNVVAAVDGAVPVYVDGGIRSGSDVFRAVALGAAAVLVGRPYLWAMAIAGQHGVEQLLHTMTEELREVMTLAGCSTVDDITRDHLAPLNLIR
ncbi:alpha-hydroxy acid oxidase [Arthrobacter zhaoguopingii]|uniref:alpha-hydroxy acid oxidase n=1 Tax=Arthrobacter zhaoguopingii TaxID=2681491 RepID=UPI001358C3B1|nr:alpha-hydroxy acid oxidase [Arthrobacter zhaoguopingii]